MTHHWFVVRYKFATLAIFSAITLACPLLASADTTDFTVNGNQMPWNWVNGGLNTGDQFGVNDGASPVVVSSAQGFNFTAGNVLTVTYLSGTVSAGSGFPFTNAMGDTALAFNGNTGSSGKVAPSFYMNPATYPINLVELVGTFANSSGDIVGTPFVIGDGPTSLTIPAGATQLQLGTNDDIYSDNAGSFTVQVVGPGTVTTTPEPSSLALLATGLLAAAGSLRRRLRK